MPIDFRQRYGREKFEAIGCEIARADYEFEHGYRKPPEKRCQVCNGGMKAAQKVCFACGAVQKEESDGSDQV